MRRVFETILVEPNVLLREGVALILNAGSFRILSSAASLDDCILSKLSQHRSVLLVIGADDNPDATATQIALFKEKQRSGRVAVLADQYKLCDVLSAFRAGAHAYFVKVTTSAVFIKYLELVMHGETIVPSEILPYILADKVGESDLEDAQALAEAESNDAYPLSSQELRILHYLVDGFSNKAIARKINIAEATVKVHVKAILRKIRVNNRTQAAVWAMNNGMFASINERLNDVHAPTESARDEWCRATQVVALSLVHKS